VRDHAGALRQEQQCFLERCGLRDGELRAVNLVDRPSLAWRDVADADALMIGGAGAHSVTQDYPFTAPLAEVVLRWIDDRRPLFASCFGHQFLGRVLGGRVLTDEARAEVGTFGVTLHAAGRRDPLFSFLPPRFPAHMGHHDRIVELPPGVVSLARSRRCPHQAIRIGDGPAYGTQFHCEMDEHRMRERLEIYRKAYLADPAKVAAFERRLRATPAIAGLLRRFLELYV